MAVILFRKSGEHVTPVALNTFKGVIALLLFFVSMLWLKIPFFPPDRTSTDWMILLLSGAVGIGIADTLFFASLNRLGASGSAIIDCAYSPAVILCAFLYLGEPIRLTLLLALAFMICAIWIGSSEPAPGGLEQSLRNQSGVLQQGLRNQRVGILLGVSSMLLMAIGIVMAKPVLNQANVWWATPVRLVGGQMLLTMQAITPMHRSSMRQIFQMSRIWLVAIPSAFLGSYLALVAWIAGMKYSPAGIAGILNQLSTIFVPILAALFLKERLTKKKILAILLGFSGALVVTLG